MAQPLNYMGAFATVTPIKKDMSDLVGNIEDNAFKYRAEQRIKDDLAQKEKEKAEEKAEKLRDRILKSPTINSTGVQSLDELNGRVLRQAIDRKFEIYQKLSKGDLSTEERTALEVENKNIDNLPENLKLGNDNIQKWFSNYDKQVSDGTAWREDNIDKKRKNGYDAFVPTLDERGLPLIGFRDLDGDGKIDPISWENIKDGVVLGNLMPKMDYNKTVDNAAKVLGTEETVDVNGYRTTTKKLVPLENIGTYADSMMFENGDVSPFTLSRARELGLGFDKELTPEDLKKIRQDLINDIYIRTEKVDKESYDYGAEDRDAARSQQERLENMKEAGRNKRANDANQVKLKTTKGLKNQPQSINSLINYSKISTEGSIEGAPKGSLGYNMTEAAWEYSPAEGIVDKVTSVFVKPDKSLQLRVTRYKQKKDGEQLAEPEDIILNSNDKKGAIEIGNYIGLIVNPKNKRPYNSMRQFSNALLEKKNANLGEQPKKKKTISGF